MGSFWGGFITWRGVSSIGKEPWDIRLWLMTTACVLWRSRRWRDYAGRFEKDEAAQGFTGWSGGIPGCEVGAFRVVGCYSAATMLSTFPRHVC